MSSSRSEYRYSSLEPANSDPGRRLADFLIRLIEGFCDVEQICDLGCGNGYLSSLLANRGYHVTGIDSSESGIALARRAYVSDRLEFICATIGDTLPEGLMDRKFDLVVARCY